MPLMPEDLGLTMTNMLSPAKDRLMQYDQLIRSQYDLIRSIAIVLPFHSDLLTNP